MLLTFSVGIAIFTLAMLSATAWNALVWWRGWPSVKARSLVEQEAVMLDVRSEQDFATGHLDGAMNLAPEVVYTLGVQGPYRSMGREFASRDQPLVVYAETRQRCEDAVRSLRATGYTRVWGLGTLSRW